MANITVNLSSNIINTLFKEINNNDTLADSIAGFFRTENSFGDNHPSFTNASLDNGRLHLSYSDGAYSNSDGVVQANPNASSGTATATSLEEYYPLHFRLTATGLINYIYSINGANTIIDTSGATISSVNIQSLLPSYSPDYDSLLGNGTDTMTGSITIAPGGALSGTVSSLSYKAEKIVASSTLSGNFSISSSNVNNSPNLGAMTVSGTASSFIEKYTDGSILSLTNLALPVSSSTVISPDLLGNEKNFAGDDVFDIVMGSPLTKAWTFASGAGNDKISLQGGGNSVLINAGTGNDTIRLADDGHVINGGAGNDTVILSANRAAYTISKTVDGYNLQTNGAAGPIDTLSGVERLQFSDATMALDISGTGGQAYRLYQAAFNRVPDSAGLGYWISAMDKGMALNDVAALFVSSKEFTDLYGTNPSNTDFLNSMYQNVLHRAGDPAGFAFWLGHMNAGDVTRSEMLAYFGESTENQAALLGSIGNGFTYSPWG